MIIYVTSVRSMLDGWPGEHYSGWHMHQVTLCAYSFCSTAHPLGDAGITGYAAMACVPVVIGFANAVVNAIRVRCPIWSSFPSVHSLFSPGNFVTTHLTSSFCRPFVCL